MTWRTALFEAQSGVRGDPENFDQIQKPLGPACESFINAQARHHQHTLLKKVHGEQEA